MIIKASAGRGVNYELDIHRKISVITDKSGTGKTTLARAISKQKGAAGNPLVLMSGVTPSLAATGLQNWSKNTFCVMDCDVFKLNDVAMEINGKAIKFARLINEAQIPFILLAREKVGELSVHYDSVYRFERGADGVTRNVRLYAPKLGLRRGICTIVEDSNIGFRFYQRLLGSSARIETVKGFGGLTSRATALLESFNEIQIIADGATFGQACGNILGIERATCFLPECFEEVLYDSEIFNRFRASLSKINPLSKDALAYPSLEN